MSQLPDYVVSATPNPADKRAPWLTTTAATYAGIMLWFVFWSGLPSGGGTDFAAGVLSQGLLFALVSLVIAALICYACFYHVPGMLGMKTGLPLYIVGTSTYGVNGGFLMPGFLMGCLQFGWLSVNGYSAGLGFACIIKGTVTLEEVKAVTGSPLHLGIGIGWTIIAAFIGLKGIKYVGMVASFLPTIPIVVLLSLLVCTVGGIFDFNPKAMVHKDIPKVFATSVGESHDAADDAVVAIEEVMTEVPVGEETIIAIVEESDEAEFHLSSVDVPITTPLLKKQDGPNFFATFFSVLRAGNWRESGETDTNTAKAVGLYGKGTLGSLAGQLGVLSLICAYVVGFFATAGAAGCDFGSNNKDRTAVIYGGLVGIAGATIFTGAIALIAIAGAQGLGLENVGLNPYESMKVLVGSKIGGLFMILLAIAAFPAACFSSLIAANSFKATLPKINPFISCGIGTAIACFLIVSGFAGQAGAVFTLIGASFGPVCGAMVADYLLSDKKWAGPREGFNLAGWFSWIIGFFVGGITLLVEGFLGGTMPIEIPCPPVSAFVVGFVLYYFFAKMGLESKKLNMPQRIDL